MVPSAKLYDVLVIGAGPGGLSVAAGLARLLYKTAIFDSGLYRNAPATHMHNVLGFDHVPPAQFRAKARADLLARYSDTLSFVDGGSVELVQPIADEKKLFRAVHSSGHQYIGRRVVLATGVTDMMEAIPGYETCWARGIFHCLFCHGYEERGAESVGVLATGFLSDPKMAIHVGRMAKQLAGKVTVYTHGNEALHHQVASLLEGDPAFFLDARVVSSVEMSGQGSEIVLTFASGETVKEDFLANTPGTGNNGPFIEQLRLELGGNGEVKTSSPFQETSMPGVYAAGDIATVMRAVPMAMAQGSMCAAGVVASLGAEEPPKPQELEDILALISPVGPTRHGAAE
jgi:gliotoxin/aspirochlorine biosynthesis thioredoxin reductase